MTASPRTPAPVVSCSAVPALMTLGVVDVVLSAVMGAVVVVVVVVAVVMIDAVQVWVWGRGVETAGSTCARAKA